MEMIVPVVPQKFCEELRNTKSNSSPIQKKKRQASPKPCWIITLKVEDWNSSNSSNLNDWIKEHCTCAIWQLEIGLKTGYKHIQLTMTLKKKNRITWLSHHFNKIAHCEIVRNEDAAFNYVVKEDTRIEGPFEYPIKVKEGIKNPLEGLQFKSWQLRILEIIKEEPDKRKIYWFWEPIGGVGKSEFCLYLILYHGAIVMDGAKKDIVYGYGGEKLIVFDLDRDQGNRISYKALETLKKGFAFSQKYESKMKVWNKPHIFVFANEKPELERLSSDKWEVVRITDDHSATIQNAVASHNDDD